MQTETMKYEALNRAVTGQSVMNYSAIYQGFMARGIPENEIIPRQNVLTFWAWQAAGRRVRKGEHGVKATTFVEMSKKPAAGAGADPDARSFRVPRSVTVFHISQTDPIV
jgi:antirestriction protein ArdC